jgi:hypothetical protein
VGVVFTKARPTRTLKNIKKLVVGLNMHESIERCFFVDDRSRHTINEIARLKESLVPKKNGKL